MGIFEEKLQDLSALQLFQCLAAIWDTVFLLVSGA
jgi:hypothetical protein